MAELPSNISAKTKEKIIFVKFLANYYKHYKTSIVLFDWIQQDYLVFLIF